MGRRHIRALLVFVVAMLGVWGVAVASPALAADGETYRLSPIRVFFSSEPIDLAQEIASAAQEDGVSLDLQGATYASSNERTATVDAEGMVTIRNVGVTTVTATLAGDQGKVTALISVLHLNLTDNQEASIAPIPRQTYTGSPVRPSITVTVGQTTLVEGTDYTVSYLDNDGPGTATAIANGLGNYTGNVSTTFTIVAAPSQEPAPEPEPEPEPGRPEAQRIYRLYNPYTGWHLYTSNVEEYDDLGAIGWQREGVAWYAPLAGPDIYRLYNPYTGWHFYTESVHERDVLAGLGWQPEGVSFHSAPSTGRPVYRLYDSYDGLHLFTASKDEYDTLSSIGWSPEGIAWYGLSVGTAPVGPLD